jgi:phosphatidylglycerol:prolipoprotein diacylglycerol transferase
MGLGWGVAYQVFFSLYPKNLNKFESHFLFWGIFVFSWIGAKSLFLLTTIKPLLHSQILSWNFWTGGGFVFYGGLIGALFFLGIVYLIKKNLTLEKLWAMIPSLIFGHAIGRIGCFLAGCCYGKETNWFWGIEHEGHLLHPTQLIEATFLFLMGLFFIKSSLSKSRLITIYFLIYGLLRFFIEFLRGDELRGQWGPLTPSQWISLLLVMTGLVLYYVSTKKFNILRSTR